MITHHIIIGLLLYSTTVTGHPAGNAGKDNSIVKETYNPNQTNGVLDPINDSFSDTAVDTLITKVVELSDRYRKDTNGTIADVQHMIQIDSTLPRLTRGEIIDLLENLTKTTPEAWRKKIDQSRKDYQRAIMLVMPYTPKNTDSLSIEELYTKPPVTHIIGTETSKPSTRKQQNTNKHIEILALEPSTSRPPITKRPYKPVKHLKPELNQETKTQVSYHQEQKPKKEVIIKPKPEIEITTHKPEISTRKFIAPKPTRYSNHKYPDETDFIPSNQGMKIINAPSLATKPDSEYWQAEKLVKPEKEIKPMPFQKPDRNVRPVQSSVYKASTMRPRIRTTSTTTTTTSQSPLSHLDVPEDMKDAIKDIHFDGLVPMQPPKYSSQYDATSMNFPKQESTTENVRDLLDSIGVLPQQTSTLVPDISEIADTLSPDMRELLMSFGLLEDPNKPARDLSQPIITQPNSEEPEISPYSYTQFKPLPDSAPSRQDMQEFLAGFGLTGNSQRSAKKMKTPNEPLPTHLTKVPEFNMEMIPESMHEVLEDIGLSEKKERKIPLDQEAKETHVFNPEQTNVSETEIKRLNQLFETIKRLEKLNRTATPEDLKDLDLENIRELTKIIKQDASIPLDQQNFGPDPFDFDLSPDKNEVKRQETTTTPKPATLAPEPAKESEAKNPSLAALEESFGGNVGAAAENIDESLPPPRRNGFYYLLDWNSFLEVGEDGKNKVNIKFSPQAGEASRFLRVNVP